MSKKTLQTQALQRFHKPRVGEGVPIEVIRQSVNHNGTLTERISLDLGSAEVPNRRYPANAASIVVDDNAVHWLLAQTKPIGQGLLSLLVINVSFLGTRQFMHAMGQIAPTSQSYLEKHNVPAKRLIDIQDTPAQTVALDANIVAAAFAGREACLDFYHASSFALHSLGQGGKLLVDPVVRVTLSAQLLMAIYIGLGELKNSMPIDELEGEL